MTSRSIYMQDISKQPGRVPSSKSQQGAIVETHRSPRCGHHDLSYHKTHTFTSSGKVASKLDWMKQPSFHWNARSSPFFPLLKKTSLQATHLCHFLLYRRRKGGRISYAAIFSFQESYFCEAPTDSHSLFFSPFHCNCGFLSIDFCLSVH